MPPAVRRGPQDRFCTKDTRLARGPRRRFTRYLNGGAIWPSAPSGRGGSKSVPRPGQMDRPHAPSAKFHGRLAAPTVQIFPWVVRSSAGVCAVTHSEQKQNVLHACCRKSLPSGYRRRVAKGQEITKKKYFFWKIPRSLRPVFGFLVFILAEGNFVFLEEGDWALPGCGDPHSSLRSFSAKRIIGNVPFKRQDAASL